MKCEFCAKFRKARTSNAISIHKQIISTFQFQFYFTEMQVQLKQPEFYLKDNGSKFRWLNEKFPVEFSRLKISNFARINW